MIVKFNKLSLKYIYSYGRWHVLIFLPKVHFVKIAGSLFSRSLILSRTMLYTRFILASFMHILSQKKVDHRFLLPNIDQLTTTSADGHTL